MPTPSEPQLRGEWAARTDTPRRSVFGNYRLPESPKDEPAASAPLQAENVAAPAAAPTLQETIDVAVARSFLNRYLATAYEHPSPETWQWLCDEPTSRNFAAAWKVVSKISSRQQPKSAPAPLEFSAAEFEPFLNAHLAAFGHAARGSCPLNEIEYGDIKADPLFQPHRLADLSAFYRAFGLEVSDDAAERHDHIAIELEFMCVLAAKEAYALEQQLDEEKLAQCRDAQKKFLREHLGRWTPAFARRLAAATTAPSLRRLADVTREFVEFECARFGVNPGSDELLLRPVDIQAESMCDSCGLQNLPPGAAPAT